MLSEMLKERNLPPLLSRDEMLAVLQREVYGNLPEQPETISFTTEEDTIGNFCAGKAVLNKVTAHCVIRGKEFSFPFYAAMPTDGKKHPFFIHINFRDAIPDRYQPTEELIDNGFAVLTLHFNDITKDNGDFTDGLAGILFGNGQRRPDDPGKIAMWAWAAHRVLDYAETQDAVLDMNCAIVCGHSRLGKTALFAAATDERFAIGYSNDSGCGGAAIARDNHGEVIENICESFSYWFCENYQQYINNEYSMPCDQHYLLASIAPRKVCVGSASEDWWADPVSEFLSCMAASPAFEKGLCYEDRMPEVGEAWFDGDVGYHLRHGRHYFSRQDWQQLIAYTKKHYPI